MSTILDALKRSEQERKLNDVPTLSDIPAPQEKSRWPLFLLSALLVIFLAIIVWLLWGKFSDKAQNQNTDQVTLASNDANNPQSVNDDNSVGAKAITVNIISYSEDATQRFTIINGKMFREGEFVSAGLKIQTIGQNSVMLNNRGELVSRQP